MGSELVLKKIKKGAVCCIIWGVILTVLGAFLSFCFLVTGDSDEFWFLYLVFAIAFVCGILLLNTGTKNIKHPEKSKTIKNNPDLLSQADELFINTKYEDKFIMLSDRVIANKKNITQMSYLDDVFLMYVHKTSYNFIPSSKEIYIETATGRIAINVYGRTKATMDELAGRICELCPNAGVGYTPENLQYLAYKREEYKQAQNNNVAENAEQFMP